MPYTIAIAGKGGTGKTTLAGFLIKYLCRHDLCPVLAVDADANSNLNEVLGVEIETTLGEIREDIAASEMADDGAIPIGMTKADYLDYKFSTALTEEDDYDLLVMGRTQGKGCYCYINSLLQTQLQKFSGQYKYIVVDNEAGMEHISRGVLPDVNLILLVSDCSLRGVQAVSRIAALVDEIGLKPDAVRLIINRAPDGKPDENILSEIERQGLSLLGTVPHDKMIYEYDCAGHPTADLPPQAPSRAAFDRLLDGLFTQQLIRRK